MIPEHTHMLGEHPQLLCLCINKIAEHTHMLAEHTHMLAKHSHIVLPEHTRMLAEHSHMLARHTPYAMHLTPATHAPRRIRLCAA